jgi:hypothetical protein
MAATSNAFVRGHSEVGHKSGATDVPWGRTAEDAVSIQLNVQTVELYSAQSVMAEDSGVTQVGMQLGINGIDGSLQNIGRVLGLPDSAFTGDLSASTNEVLTFDKDDIGASALALYSKGPGPLSSVRRIDAPNCKLASAGALAQAKTGWMLPSAVFNILVPATGNPLTITDDAAS